MVVSLKRNTFSLTLLVVFIAAFSAVAQYAGIPERDESRELLEQGEADIPDQGYLLP